MRRSDFPISRKRPISAFFRTFRAEIAVAAASAARFASLYARDVFGDRLRARIDDKLGAGAGKLVEGALEGLFGGGRKKSRTQAEP